jgi:ProP effector
MKSMNTISSVAESPEINETAAAGDLPAPGDQGESQLQVQAESSTDTDADTGADDADGSAVTGADTGAAEKAAPAGSGSDAQSPRALLKQLQQQFKAFRECLPLAIGIDKQVLSRMPGLNRKTMRTALGIHTGSMRYLRAMEKATVRYDLDGNAGAEVTDTHRQHAKELLQERYKKEADRKKAERDAAVEAEAERKRQEKLQQLASKFSRR